MGEGLDVKESRDDSSSPNEQAIRDAIGEGVADEDVYTAGEAGEEGRGPGALGDALGEDLFDSVTNTWSTALLSARPYHEIWTRLRGLGHTRISDHAPLTLLIAKRSLMPQYGLSILRMIV
jgi:hypothetical protein